MKVLSAHDEYGWITAIIEGRWVQAKVYNKPSTFGINEGRVSKLAISKTDRVDNTKAFHEQMCYNYDRGLNFDHIEPKLLETIVNELESLPTYEIE